MNEKYNGCMKRIIFKKNQQREFLKQIKDISGLTFEKLGRFCNKGGRTVCGWYHEESSMPLNIANDLSSRFNVPLPKDSEVKPAFWHVKQAGRKGAFSYIKKYGSPGTPEGRRLGGLRSQSTHKKLGTAFKQRKSIKLAKKDELLAEFFGIILGDGSISNYQVSISLNNNTDAIYGDWIIRLIDDLFGLKTGKSVRRENTLELAISSIGLVEFLISNGLFRGDKLRNRVTIPPWIKENEKFTKACIRGLIDTDGSVYIDRHKHKDGIYQSLCVAFSNASNPLIDAVFESLEQMDLEPRKYWRSVKLRKWDKIKKYFTSIGSHNPKHFIKFENFDRTNHTRITGEVA